MFESAASTVFILWSGLVLPAYGLPAGDSEKPTPQDVTKLLAEKGCRHTVEGLFGDGEKEWRTVLDGVAGGSRDWLLVAQKLHSCTDAHASETLRMAIEEALANAPSLTLEMFGAETCRGVGFAGEEAESLDQVLREVARRKKALETVTRPALATAKKKCLRFLQETEKSAPTWEWAH